MERRSFLISTTCVLAASPTWAWDGEAPTTTLPPRTKGAHGLRSLWWEIFDASRDIGNWWGEIQGWMLKERLRIGQLSAAVSRKLKDKKLSDRDRKNLEKLDERLKKRFNSLLELLTGKSAPYVPSRNAQAGPNPWDKAKVHTRAAEKAAGKYQKAEPGSGAAKSHLSEARKQLKAAHRIIDRARAQFAKELKATAKDIATARKAGVATDLMTEKTEKAIKASATALEKTVNAKGKAITKAIDAVKIR